jgi:prepilin-type N-terminal cleavage/methylation domain-containing protein
MRHLMTLGSDMKRGFTLIELLVVISIISLLSSVVLASLSSAREKSKKARAQAEMSQIVKIIMYAQGEQGKPLIRFAPSSNYANGTCNTFGIASSQCLNQWISALTEIQTATNGTFTDLAKFQRDPWGNPYQIDANQGETGASSCGTADGFFVYGKTFSIPVIPLSPICP